MTQDAPIARPVDAANPSNPDANLPESAGIRADAAAPTSPYDGKITDNLNDKITDKIDRIAPELVRAIDAVILAEHSQRHWLRPDAPPIGARIVDGRLEHEASLADGVAHYGAPSAALDLWMAVRAATALRVLWSWLAEGEP